MENQEELRLKIWHDQYAENPFEAWGDVYGFTVEKKVKFVRIPAADFDAGNFCDNAEREEEWEHEDSCGGFYGNDFETNGIKDHLPKSLHESLANFDHSDVEYRN